MGDDNDDELEERGAYLEDAFSSGTSSASETDETSDSPDPPITSDASNTSKADEASDTSDSSGTSTAGEADETTPLRDRPTKLLYLEEELKRELELAFDELNLRYKRERDEELRQNDDWWPVLLQVGYEAIGDVSDIDLEEFDTAREGRWKEEKAGDSSE